MPLPVEWRPWPQRALSRLAGVSATPASHRLLGQVLAHGAEQHVIEGGGDAVAHGLVHIVVVHVGHLQAVEGRKLFVDKGAA